MRHILLVFLLSCFSIVYGQDLRQRLKAVFWDVSEQKDEDGHLWYKIRNGDGWGLVDETGKQILPCLYTDDFIFKKSGKNLLIKATKSKNGILCVGLFDCTGTNLIECDKKSIDINEDFISIQSLDGRFGIADRLGKIVLDCVSSHRIAFTSVEKFATYNIGGKVKILFESSGGKNGVIGKNPVRILTPAKYDHIILVWDSEKSDFSKDYLYVNNGGTDPGDGLEGGEWGVINSEGKEIIKPMYTRVSMAANHLFTICNKDDKWGLMDDKGNLLMPCEYDGMIVFKSDVAMVKKDGEVKIIKNPLVENATVEIAGTAAPSNKKDLGGPAVSRYPAPDSDVDKDIPQASRKSENTFAFVVANENYPDAPVPYALNDGRMFAEYCEKALGIPKKNINMYEDATYGNIITMMDKIKSIASAYDGDATVVVYYAGHGFPDEKQSTAYLLPVDGSGSEITTTGYSLAHLYDELSKLPLKDAIVFLDACFSGAKREDDMLAQSRGVAIKVKNEQPKGNLLVFTAAQGDETAHQMEEKYHGLFTYFLLKGMQQLKGNANLGDLTDFVTKNVKRQSVVINNKRQTPTVIPSPAMTDTWRSNTICSK